MADPLIAEIKFFGANWAPKDWAICAGAVIAISDYTALYSLIGTIYGGDGRTSFALPDLRGRTAVGQGSGPALTSRIMGQMFGREKVTLDVDHLPAHNHAASVDITKWGATLSATSTAVNPSGTASATASVNCNNVGGNGSIPTARYLADGGNNSLFSNTKGPTTMAADMVEVDVTIDSLNIPIETSGTVTLNAVAGAVVTGDTGGSLPFDVCQPSTVMNYIIATDGTYPSRN